MTKKRIAINGMGRIGRTLTREIMRRQDELNLELVAVNNPGDMKAYIHLLEFDSVHGRVDAKITTEGDTFLWNGKKIKFFNIYDPSEIPWGDYKVDIVIDATGRFKDKESLSKHRRDTVKKVIMCAPGKNLDGTFVMGINHESFDSKNHHIVSNASCTTNCLAPVAKVIHEAFEIENGFMTTVHAYTSDQNLLDNSHRDLRRARAAAMNMIPTTTGAAKALGTVIPELQGKMDGFAVRVPTSNVSMVDLTVNVSKDVSIEKVNSALKKASEESLKGILAYTDLPLVSGDFNGTTESSWVDSSMTNVIGKTVKVVAWYDNEAGFSNRVLDLAEYMGGTL